MLRQVTVGTLQGFAWRDPAIPEDIDYDADYRALDLMPGASHREIQDRGRLLCTAFQPDGLPDALRAEAAERARQISRAADRLSRYWKTHGVPPPSGQAAQPGAWRERPGRATRQAESGYRLGRSDGVATAPAAAGLTRVRPDARNSAEQSAALRAAIVSRAAAPPGYRRGAEPPKRRPLATAGSVLFKLAMVGLVVAAAVRVQQYRADHPFLSPFSEPTSAIAIGMPGDPPVRWSGMMVAGRQFVGAAAPAIAGRQRQD